MNYMIEFKPLDALFFRDGKPFGMGEQNFAEEIFPPYPSTFYGAIRGKLIAENSTVSEFYAEKNKALKEIAGTASEKGKLRIVGPFINYKQELYFPFPADLVMEEGFEMVKLHPYRLEELPFKGNLLNRNRVIYYYNYQEIMEREKNLYLSHKALIRYLKAEEFDRNEILKSGEIYKKEGKIGIKLDSKTKTAETHMIYRLNMIRLIPEASLVVFADNFKNAEIKFPEEGLMQLGGEGRAVYYKLKNAKTIGLNKEEFKEAFEKADFIKLYLLTPAFIEQNKETPSMQKLRKLGLEIVGFSINGIIPIGGWNISEKMPKTMRKAWAAGSVVLIDKDKSLNPDEIYENLNFKPIFSEGEDYKEGYGYVLIGIEKRRERNV